MKIRILKYPNGVEPYAVEVGVPSNSKAGHTFWSLDDFFKTEDEARIRAESLKANEPCVIWESP